MLMYFLAKHASLALFYSRPPRPSHSLTLHSALTLSLPLTTLPKLLIATAGIRLVCLRRPRRAAGESSHAALSDFSWNCLLQIRDILFVLKSQVVCIVAGQMLDTGGVIFQDLRDTIPLPHLVRHVRSALAGAGTAFQEIKANLPPSPTSRRVASVGG